MFAHNDPFILQGLNQTRNLGSDEKSQRLSSGDQQWLNEENQTIPLAPADQMWEQFFNFETSSSPPTSPSGPSQPNSSPTTAETSLRAVSQDTQEVDREPLPIEDPEPFLVDRLVAGEDNLADPPTPQPGLRQFPTEQEPRLTICPALLLPPPPPPVEEELNGELPRDLWDNVALLNNSDDPADYPDPCDWEPLDSDALLAPATLEPVPIDAIPSPAFEDGLWLPIDPAPLPAPGPIALASPAFEDDPWLPIDPAPLPAPDTIALPVAAPGPTATATPNPAPTPAPVLPQAPPMPITGAVGSLFATGAIDLTRRLGGTTLPKTSNVKVHKRVKWACENCQAIKTKCVNVKQNQCERCAELGLICEYTNGFNENNKKRPGPKDDKDQDGKRRKTGDGETGMAGQSEVSVI
ncbi:uncharacterized protein I206_107419 [Kwoniella pini CBS 10737]|uniref:Zn(2)-C6 fungal-type domain-containing protein n=1 Tax=Kwoniella pini CBS 10737 TaxID=1296096 RepID=A0A1B9HX90_9TREE|nr:uncharacterized protein I206_05745 [Kwoniella pini CBS 10737]OCF47882.1 hypothetical protein I206_05745 [Kwoniella pini CBS 10737]